MKNNDFIKPEDQRKPVYLGLARTEKAARAVPSSLRHRRVVIEDNKSNCTFKNIKIAFSFTIMSVCALPTFSQTESDVLIFEYDENGAIVCEEHISEQEAEDSMYVYQSPYMTRKAEKSLAFWKDGNVQMAVRGNGKLTVNLLRMPVDANCALRITTVSGMKMLSADITAPFSAFDISQLSSGQYIISLILGNDVYSKKIVLGN